MATKIRTVKIEKNRAMQGQRDMRKTNREQLLNPALYEVSEVAGAKCIQLPGLSSILLTVICEARVRGFGRVGRWFDLFDLFHAQSDTLERQVPGIISKEQLEAFFQVTTRVDPRGIMIPQVQNLNLLSILDRALHGSHRKVPQDAR